MKKTVPYKTNLLTPDQAVRRLWCYMIKQKLYIYKKDGPDHAATAWPKVPRPQHSCEAPKVTFDPNDRRISWAVSFKKQQIFYAFKVAKLIKQPLCWCPSFSPLELPCWYYATNLRKFVHYYLAHMSENPTAPQLWTKNPKEAHMRWVGIGCFLQFSVLKN